LIAGAVFFLIALIVLYYVVAVSALSVLAILFTATTVWALNHRLYDHDRVSFQFALCVSCIGFFLYLMYVLAMGFLVAHIKVSASGFLATLGRAAFQLGRETLASVSSARNGEMDFKGMVGNDLGSVWTRIGALATLHGPGSLMYCFVINRYIGKPFTGRGILLAAVVVLTTLPLGVATACWIVAMYSRGS
jgi:hypothetical protein